MEGILTVDKIDVSRLTEAQATLLMPLWARATETRRARPLLRDEKAVEIVDSLDFDFRRFEAKKVPVVDFCVRSRIIDALVREQMGQAGRSPRAAGQARRLPHDDGQAGRLPYTVVEFGVGLDTRFDRLDDGEVHWVEVDLPGVMEVRRQFFSPGPRREMITASLMDKSWMDNIPAERAAPPIFVAEGVLYYFDTREIRQFFTRLADRFPGATLVFDAQSPLFLRLSNWRHPLSSSRLRFSLGRNAAEIARWDPRFRVERYVGFGDAPYYDEVLGRLSFFKRLVARLGPLGRHFFKIVQVRLG